MTQVSGALAVGLKTSKVTPITPHLPIEKTAADPKIMNCDVVFGSPSLDCAGTGICRITGTNSIKPMLARHNCRRTSGKISISAEGKVSLFFFRPYLCIHLYRQHFHKGVFTVLEPCAIPSDIAAALQTGLKTILPGSYSVIEKDGYYRVDLNGM